jgi:hypothetical protein
MMRFRDIFFAFTLPLLLLCSCGREEDTITKKKFRIESAVRCTYHEQNIKIKFTMEDSETGKLVCEQIQFVIDIVQFKMF